MPLTPDDLKSLIEFVEYIRKIETVPNSSVVTPISGSIAYMPTSTNK